jgi:hypothetical protein
VASWCQNDPLAASSTLHLAFGGVRVAVGAADGTLRGLRAAVGALLGQGQVDAGADVALLNAAGAGGLAQVTGVAVGATVVAAHLGLLVRTGHAGAGGALGVAQLGIHHFDPLVAS